MTKMISFYWNNFGLIKTDFHNHIPFSGIYKIELSKVQCLILQNHFLTQRHWFLCFLSQCFLWYQVLEIRNTALLKCAPLLSQIFFQTTDTHSPCACSVLPESINRTFSDENQIHILSRSPAFHMLTSSSMVFSPLGHENSIAVVAQDKIHRVIFGSPLFVTSHPIHQDSKSRVWLPSALLYCYLSSQRHHHPSPVITS